MKKVLAVTVMILFISVSIIPSTGNLLSLDDVTPPVTTHSLSPLKPNGKNGYYISNVTVTLNARDDESGVDRIEYRIDGGSWQAITGENGTFIIRQDGNDMVIEYRAVDNAGNQEDTNEFIISMDLTQPELDYIYNLAPLLEDSIWYECFRANAEDWTSGMDRVEFFIEDEHRETIIGSGPDYDFIIEWDKAKWLVFNGTLFWFYYYDRAGNEIFYNFTIPFIPGDDFSPPRTPRYVGLIYNPVITEGNTSFFALIVKYIEPYSSQLFKLEPVKIEYDYEGYIGKYFIRIFLNDWYPFD